MKNKINIIINKKNFTATLEDNETSKKLLEMLPLEINMNELNGNEKYFYLNKSLPTNSSRVGSIERGDIMLYGNNCLVIFYKSFTTSYSYTKIGKIDNPSSLKKSVGKENITIKIS